MLTWKNLRSYYNFQNYICFYAFLYISCIRNCQSFRKEKQSAKYICDTTRVPHGFKFKTILWKFQFTLIGFSFPNVLNDDGEKIITYYYNKCQYKNVFRFWCINSKKSTSTSYSYFIYHSQFYSRLCVSFIDYFSSVFERL